jgi:hypothetical protein
MRTITLAGLAVFLKTFVDSRRLEQRKRPAIPERRKERGTADEDYKIFANRDW